MKRNWIFIAVLCLIPYNVITSVSDMKTDIAITEKKVKEIVAEEFRKVVTLTTYSVTEEETDSSPTITASGFEIDENNPNKHRIIAVSRDLKRKYKFGTKLRIKGAGKYDGTYVVRDVMNKRYTKRIDILVGKKDKQTKLKKIKVYKLK